MVSTFFDFNQVSLEEFKFRPLIYIYWYTNVYIITGLFSFLLVISIVSKSKKDNRGVLKKMFLQSLYYPIRDFKDNYLILIIWILGGFPPFVLFLLKFYVLYFIA